MNEKITIGILLFLILGFCVGFVIGYWFVGSEVDSKCRLLIEDRDFYINNYCVNNRLLQNFSIPDSVFGIEEDDKK